MNNIALITGITGQDGSYLAEFLLSKKYEVHGIVRRTSSFSTGRLDGIYKYGDSVDQRVQLHLGDMSDQHSLISIINEVKPTEVYNLAAQSHVRVSFDQASYTADVTALGALRILEAIKDFNKNHSANIKFYQASSSEMFGKVFETPQTEKTPFHPRSPYGVAKLYAHWITVNFRESYNIHATCGILFNHESPRRGETFVTKKITRSVGRIAVGLQKKLCLGNLEARRDWGFSGDYVEAMWLMLQHSQPDDYVISTGQTHTVREFCERAFKRVNLNYEDCVEIDPQFYRPAEVDLLVGDSTKALQTLGWKPKIQFNELVDMMVDYDLELAHKEKSLTTT